MALRRACALTKWDFSSLDFRVKKFFMNLFRTGNIEVVKNCQACFEFSPPSVLWAERMKKFEAKYLACDEPSYITVIAWIRSIE